MIRAVLCDIEGTTTSISFVHDELFPLSLREMLTFLSNPANTNELEAELQKVRTNLAQNSNGGDVSIPQLADYFCELIRNDVKDTLLKKIQGKIWKTAYEQGQVKGHLYPDVKPAWEAWRAQGKKIAIYSSGSVEAQKLIFGYSTEGDLTPMITAYFDTTTGPKKEANSYIKIADLLRLAPSEILFLSDSLDEIKAADNAGCQVIRLVRPPGQPNPQAPYLEVASFSEIHC